MAGHVIHHDHLVARLCTGVAHRAAHDVDVGG
jgi:hypothetical protein